MIKINGSQGEGGGQILRTSLSMALITSQSLCITQIREGRKQPGLKPQHLKSVKAAIQISRGEATGAELGSNRVVFTPKAVIPGSYTFDIGTAGATSLLLQTILIPLGMTDNQSNVTVRGGTHVPWSPCFHYLAWHWNPYLLQMGFNFDFSLDLAGYYPQGNGIVKVDVQPSNDIVPINLEDRGKVTEIWGFSAVSNLPMKIAERQRNRVIRRIGHKYPLNDIRTKYLPSKFRGTVLFLMVESEYARACFFGLGALGKPAENVADEAVDALLNHMSTEGAIDPFLADQLLLPMTLANGISSMTTSEVTPHLVTNAIIIQHFFPVKIVVNGEIGFPGRIVVEPSSFSMKD